MKCSPPADSSVPIGRPVARFMRPPSLRYFSSGPGKTVLLTIACLLQVAVAGAQTVYNWQTTTGTWSGSTNWSPTVTGTAGPGASDTANIDNLATSSTVTYNTAASGTVGTLTFQQSVNNVTTVLSLAQNLTIATAGSMYAITGTEQINLNNSNLTIASGANLTLGSTSPTLNLPATAPTYITTAGSGGIIVSGTLESAYSGSANTTFQPAINAPVTLASGGVIDVETDGTSGSGNARLVINGNFDSSAGGTIEATGPLALKSMLFLSGTSVIIGNTTITGFLQTSNVDAAGGIIFDSNPGTQTIQLGQVFAFGIRVPSGGTSSANAVFVKDISSTAVSSSISNAIGIITFNPSANYSTIDLQLESNLNAAQSTTFGFNWGSTSAYVDIDLNGYEYNATTNGSTSNFTPTTPNIGQNEFNFLNSGSSSISAGQGIFKAGGFAFNSADVSVGSGVILQATHAGNASNLGVVSGGVTTISANSTFYYSGTGTASLASNRNIGGIMVGNGTAVATLQMASAITAAGAVTLNNAGTLDLNSNSLTLTGSASLGGAGAVSNTGGGGTGISFASGATGGLTPGGGTTVARLTFASGLAVGLASTSLSVFDLASTSSYDQISGGSLTLTGSLEVNLLAGFTGSSQTSFTLFNGTLSGGFSDAGNVTLEGAGASGYSATFNNATGVLSIFPVPEPSTVAMMTFSGLFGVFSFFRRKRAKP